MRVKKEWYNQDVVFFLENNRFILFPSLYDKEIFLKRIETSIVLFFATNKIMKGKAHDYC